MDGGSSAPPIGAAGGAAGGGAAGGGGGGLTFPASFAQRQTAPPPIGGGFGRPDESAMVDSLVSQFSEINTAFDPEATLRRFVEVTNLPVEQARGLLTSARPTSLAIASFARALLPRARCVCAGRSTRPPTDPRGFRHLLHGCSARRGPARCDCCFRGLAGALDRHQ